MAIVLFLLGALSVASGAAMLGFGIPIREFGFGNSLLLGGVVALVGGFIVIGLGTLAAQLQRVGEMLGARQLPRNARPLEPFELPTPAPASARIPFPPKPRAEHRVRTEPPPKIQSDFPPPGEPLTAPLLPNPEIADEAPLSPRQLPPMPAPALKPAEFAEPAKPAMPPPPAARTVEPAEPEPDAEPAAWSIQPPPRMPSRQAPPPFFDAPWPRPEPQSEKADAELPRPARAERIPRAGVEEPRAAAPEPPPASPLEPPAAEPRTAEPRAIAILKSGVIDGMGYTLYVDGSIEAELPHGTVRFASINDLRTHLDKS
jgi:hypothetical protein